MNKFWNMIKENEDHLDKVGDVSSSSFINEWSKATTYNVGDCVISHHNERLKRKIKRFNKSSFQRVTCCRKYTALSTSVKVDIEGDNE